MLCFYRIKSFNSKKLSGADQKHDTADCWYFGSIAQVTFAAIEITPSDRDRLILSVYLAIVVVAYRFYCTPVLKNPVRYTFPFFISFNFFAPKTRPGAIGQAVSFTETRSSHLSEISQFPTPVWRKNDGTLFGLFVFVVVLRYWQRVINGKHPLSSGATSGNFLEIPQFPGIPGNNL